ncbi:S41 family peptidase [Polaribacter aestuariivivens]|uniref:S41 family peptidase n=1 Tax=Polaribacter aestuariivivens TaxID=2304626 RepID=UPI003F497D74
MKNIFKITTLVLSFLIFYNCSKKVDNIPMDIEINDFVWKGLNASYYWQSDVPDLSDTRFSNQNELNDFTAGFDTPEDIFQSLRFQPGVVDRFSVIVDDYIALENSFQGIRLSNGMEFKLYRNKGNTSNVYGVVYYVIPGSDAESKGVLRGMVFSAIDGTQITDTNFSSLLFGSNVSYNVNFADFNAGNPVVNGTTINLVKEQLQENPVAITKIFNEGTNKIGYLLYNQFASSFDGQLNAAFATFKSENITDLIIDLRYNGGGSVRTATYLGSMINGSNNGKLFSQEIWNEKVMANTNPDVFLNNFTNQIVNRDSNGNTILDEPINSLNLQRVYFIVTDDTASASELVINGMDAYIDVNLVGTKTVGKQVGSITLYDSDNYRRNGLNLNPNHTYAMQPIVLEIKNANGQNNANGYTPDVILAEDFGRDDNTINLGVLGEKSDPLLDRTITFITTGAKLTGKPSFFNQEKPLLDSKFIQPFSQEMFVENFRK